MSLHENIQVFHPVDVDQYMDTLKNEQGAREHPSQPGCCIIGEDGIPFYEPRQSDDHISILGFNYTPLSEQLLQALIDHPELAPDDVIIRWTQEQDLILESTLGNLRVQAGEDPHSEIGE